MRLACATFVLLLAFAAPAAAEQLVAERLGVQLHASVRGDGAICERLAGALVADLGCRPIPADPAADARSLVVRGPLSGAPIVRVGLVTPGTTALRVVGHDLAPSVPGPSPLARHVLSVLPLPVRGDPFAAATPRIVVALDAAGAFRSIAELRRLPAITPGLTPGGVGLRAQALSANAVSRPALDPAASVAASRIVRRPRTCLTFYVYRAPRSTFVCFPPGPTPPYSCQDIYGSIVLGLASAHARTIELRDAAGRTILRRPVATLPVRLGGGTAYVALLPSSGAQPPARTLLLDARGRVLLDRRRAPRGLYPVNGEAPGDATRQCGSPTPSGGTSPPA